METTVSGSHHNPAMPRFLSIETSGDACSVSLIDADHVRSLDTGEPRSHARLLVPLIKDLMKDLMKDLPGPLDGICVDEGPGSYTGLRIGVSTAKGLAWSLGCPLHAISSLELLAAAVPRDHTGVVHVRAMLPSRGEAVFSARYTAEGESWQKTDDVRYAVPSEFLDEDPSGTIVVVPDGVEIHPEWTNLPDHRIPLHSSLAAPLLRNQSDRYRVQELSVFEPLYVRSFVARKPKVSIFDRLPF